MHAISHTVRWTIPAIAMTVGSGILASVPAFVPAPQNAEYEIPLPTFDARTFRTLETLAATRTVTEAAAAKFGGEWRVYSWSASSGTARDLYGSGLDLGAPITTDEAADAVARGVIADNPEIFAADVSNLTLDAIARGRGKVGVHYRQTYLGIEVLGSKIYTIFTEDGGRLFVMGSNYHGDISLDPTPALARSEAIGIARDAVPFDPSTDAVEDEVDLLIVPVPTSPSSVQHRLAWRVRVQTHDPLGIWVTHVDAHTGEIFYRYNDVRFFDYEGTSALDTQPITYCDGTEPAAAKYMYVDVDGLPQITTGADGTWAAGVDDTVDRSASAALQGPYVTIQNFAGDEASWTGTATPGEPTEIYFDISNSQADERDVFDGVNDIHDFFQEIDPTFAYASEQIVANVSIDENCNAFWFGSINFYREGGGCANTGEIQGVVQHEYGHGVQSAVIGGQGNEGLGEGNADVLANIMTRESIIGRGFSLDACSTGLRNSDNDLRYPEHVVGREEHDAGRVIAGFHWDMAENLRASLGEDEGWRYMAELWHYARKLHRPVYQPDQVLANFIADDDDGDLTNGTPNYLDLCAAAEHHGFSCPASSGVHFWRSATSNTVDRTDPISIVVAPFSTDGSIVPSSVEMHYRIDGGSFIDVGMTPTGDPDEYEASIPAQPLGTLIEYWVEASDDLGSTGTGPADAPASLHGFYVAAVYDPFEEDDAAWTVGLPDDDATRGIWERVDPIGTTAQASVDATPSPGTDAWITGQHEGPEGGWQGQSQINDGKTTLISPVYDISASTQFARLQYRRWFSNDTGPNPGEDPWIVRVSNDGGETFVEVENTTVSDRSWLFVEHDLWALFGGSVGQIQVQFEASDYAPSAVVEAGVDDFTIIADLGEGTVAVEPTLPGIPRAAYLAEARPNPFRPRTTIRYGLNDEGPVTLAVYDVGGRRVRGLVNAVEGAGHHAVSWDGLDDTGVRAPSGVYYVRVEGPDLSDTKRVTLVR